MRVERVKNTRRNMVWGVINKLIALLLNFATRTAIIKVYGINYAGLSSLFTSIITALNLAELGFGSAVVFFMYKAIADDDENRLCELLAYFRKAYKIIGLIILIVGLSITPFLELFIYSDIPEDINIYIVYVITILGTAVSYFLFAYRSSILEAHQRKDIILNINSIAVVIERLLQIFMLVVAKNYYYYAGVSIFTYILNNLLIFYVMSKKYPRYIPRGTLPQQVRSDIGEKIRGLIMYKIGGFVSGSVDSIVISAFLGLTIMGKYGNYYYVIYALFSFYAVYYSAIRAGIGNSIITESKSKNYDDFFTFQFIQNWIVCWCCVCLLCLFQDFIIIYAGSDNTLPIGIVIVLCLYFWSWKIQDVVHIYKEASGLWNQDQLRPIIGAGINLTLNIILVNIIGLYGVLLSTVIVLVFFDLPWASSVLYKNIFSGNRKDYYFSILRSFIETVIFSGITYFVCFSINTGNNYFNLALKFLICIVFPNILYYFFYRKNKNYIHFMKWVKQSFIR